MGECVTILDGRAYICAGGVTYVCSDDGDWYPILQKTPLQEFAEGVWD